MKTIYLRAETQADMRAALLEAGIFAPRIDQDEEGNAITVYDLDPSYQYSSIGLIYKATGEIQEVDIGGEISLEPVMLPVPGWHSNLRGVLTEDQESILPIIADPVTPERIFAT